MCLTVSDDQPVARTIYRAVAGYHAGGPILIAAHCQSGSTSIGQFAVTRLTGRIQHLRRAIHGESAYVAHPIASAVAVDATRQPEFHVSHAASQPGGLAYRKFTTAESSGGPGEL